MASLAEIRAKAQGTRSQHWRYIGQGGGDNAILPILEYAKKDESCNCTIPSRQRRRSNTFLLDRERLMIKLPFSPAVKGDT